MLSHASRHLVHGRRTGLSAHFLSYTFYERSVIERCMHGLCMKFKQRRENSASFPFFPCVFNLFQGPALIFWACLQIFITLTCPQEGDSTPANTCDCLIGKTPSTMILARKTTTMVGSCVRNAGSQYYFYAVSTCNRGLDTVASGSVFDSHWHRGVISLVLMCRKMGPCTPE